MKLKFKVQPYQTNAVEAVIDCFAGQVNNSNISYRIDPGTTRHYNVQQTTHALIEKTGFKNSEILLSEKQILENIHTVQRRQNLELSEKLYTSSICRINLDVEMETGTGKTYCYIKTIFEMNKRFGWSKFIIVVPSIAIREGVFKSFEITAEHFSESYGKKTRFFIYNSKQLHQLENFSSDAGINAMIINVQAFNAKGSDARRIYGTPKKNSKNGELVGLDDFQSRKPIDVISANHPILILDEPQKMEGDKTLASLKDFKPLMILRYSATHRTTYNKVHRLDALDAYNQKLVKKIAVRGITVKGLTGTNAYLYLEAIEISKKTPTARIEFEIKLSSGIIKRVTKPLAKGDNLFDESGELDQYRGFVISQIDYVSDTVGFTNGYRLVAGEATGDINESIVRRIQIREAIKAHFEKERQLFSKGIKVLSLFFIDEVAKYRDYTSSDEKGEYAHTFEEEYSLLKDEYLGELALDNLPYRKYLAEIPVAKTHNGYFSIDKKTNHFKDPEVGRKESDSDDVDAYDLILKDKERLLSFTEPVRFIFSHSALREGWDNPNVFVMCMLKHSNNTISRRQEVGRGLRLSVNQYGDRQDHPGTVHDINVLTVVASESYKEFVENLQREIGESLSTRPRKASVDYFTGKVIVTSSGVMEISPEMAKQLYHYLIKNDYVDTDDKITSTYHSEKKDGALKQLPQELKEYSEQIFKIVDSVFSDIDLPGVDDDRKPKNNPLNANFEKKEFKELWSRINRKAIYRVDFETAELIRNCIETLNRDLQVTRLQFTVQRGEQIDSATYDQVQHGEIFKVRAVDTQEHAASVQSQVRYDLLGKLSEATKLTRKTIASILNGVHKDIFGLFKQNPEHFLSEVTRLIKEQKAAVIIERLSYNEIDAQHDIDIFTAGQTRQDFSRAVGKLNNHIYDYAITDSKVETNFVKDLDVCTDVVVYAKLPHGFQIPTPVGDYNPDWAISFKEGAVKHIYFVAETKGSMSTLQLSELENTKIKCARKFFEVLNQKITTEHVKYDVVDSFGKLMDIVGSGRNG